MPARPSTSRNGNKARPPLTSGTHSPTLGKSIGLGYVPPALSEPGTEIQIIVREKPIAAQIVSTPFVAKHSAN